MNERPKRVTVEIEYEKETFHLEVPNPGEIIELGAVPVQEPLRWFDRTVQAPVDYDVSLKVRARPDGPAGTAVVYTIKKDSTA